MWRIPARAARPSLKKGKRDGGDNDFGPAQSHKSAFLPEARLLTLAFMPFPTILLADRRQRGSAVAPTMTFVATKTADQSALHRVPERLVSKHWDQQSDWVPCCGKWGTPPDNFAAPEEMSQPRRNHNVGCSSGAVRGKHVTSISDQTPLQCRQ